MALRFFHVFHIIAERMDKRVVLGVASQMFGALKRSAREVWFDTSVAPMRTQIACTCVQ